MKKSWFLVAAAVPLVLVASIGFWKVSGNDARSVGALGPLKEPVPLSWRGEWAKDSDYAGGEVVSYQGVSYVAETANSAREPDPSGCGADCPWSVLGQAGSGGAPGPVGPQGPKGDQGDRGPQGLKGDTGNPGSGAADSCTGETVTLQGGTNGANLSATSSYNYSSLAAQKNPTTSSSNGAAIVVCGGTLSNLSVTGSPENANGSYTVEVRVNGIDRGLSCHVPSGAGVICSDTAHNITLASGDKVNVILMGEAGSRPMSATWTTSYTRESRPGL